MMIINNTDALVKITSFFVLFPSLYFSFYLFKLGIRKRILTLDHLGFRIVEWRYKIHFANVKHIYVFNNKFYVVFKEPQPSLKRYIPKFFKFDYFNLDLGPFSDDIYERIIEYYKRDAGEEGKRNAE
jgi:hypothetical protein